jgi:hypothetical protein
MAIDSRLAIAAYSIEVAPLWSCRKRRPSLVIELSSLVSRPMAKRPCFRGAINA